MDESFDDPTAMTPEQRRQEMAAILARGVLRLRQARLPVSNSQSGRTAESTTKSLQNGLAKSAESRLHVSTREPKGG